MREKVSTSFILSMAIGLCALAYGIIQDSPIFIGAGIGFFAGYIYAIRDKKFEE